MADLCEVRVLTYRRPEWLRRALGSLMEQGHTDWVAIILDDSPDREGERVVRDLGDRRFHYRPNRERLGAARNTDQAFGTRPLAGGVYSCVLEDDNWYLPDFLGENIRCLKATGCPILMRNQRIDRASEAGGEATVRTTRGHLLDEGSLDPEVLHSLVLLCEGISNGGLFWRTDMSSDLVVGPCVADAYLQEHCRTLQVNERAHFAAEPLAVWSDTGASLATRRPCGDRMLSRGRQSIHSWLWGRYGSRMLPWIRGVAARAGIEGRLEENLGYIGVRLPGVPLGRFLRWRMKSLLRALTTPDPLAGYFQSHEFTHRAFE